MSVTTVVLNNMKRPSLQPVLPGFLKTALSPVRYILSYYIDENI